MCAKQWLCEDVVPPMSKEEMHSVVYNHDYYDGTELTKAISIKLVNFVDNYINTQTPATYANLLLEVNNLVKATVKKGNAYGSFT